MFVFENYVEVEKSLYKDSASYVDVFYAGGMYQFNVSRFTSGEMNLGTPFSTLEELAESVMQLESPVVFTVQQRLTEEEILSVNQLCREMNIESNKESMRGLVDTEIDLLRQYLE